MACCHATEIPTILKSFYCLLKTSVHCLYGKTTLGYPQQKEDDSGMYLSSVTHLLDLVFSCQEQNNTMICNFSRCGVILHFAETGHPMRQLALLPPADPLPTRKHLQNKVSGELIVVISNVKANSQQGCASGSWTMHVHSKHRWNFRPFIAVRATRLSQLSTSFWVMNTRTPVPGVKGKV